MQPFIAQICIFGFNFPPEGWTFAAGQFLTISQYNAVFALVGTFYGGDGRVTFGVPDLRGRMPLGSTGGTGPGLPPYQIGMRGGINDVVLTTSHMPQHNHDAAFTPSGGGDPVTGELKGWTTGAATGTSGKPPLNGQFLTGGGTSDTFGPPNGFGGTEFTLGGLTVSGGGSSGGTVVIGDTGASSPLNIQNPYQAVNFCFALEGVFPQRS
jgi:microcystin-dependent protein